MKKIIFNGALCLLLASCCPCEKQTNTVINSPDGSLSVHLGVKPSKQAYYLVLKDNKVVIDTSLLGIVREDADFSKDLQPVSFEEPVTVKDSYHLFHGKLSNIKYKANSQTMKVATPNNLAMEITFNVSNDGFAFKYKFPETSEDVKHITEEKSAFNFKESARGWLQPLAKAKTGWEKCNPSYEEHYKKGISLDTPSEIGEGWVYPALINDGAVWAAISETYVEPNYAASHLKYSNKAHALQVTFPQPEEKMTNGALNPESKLPWETPWRIVALGDLATVTNSTLGTDLAKPAVIDDTYYVKPGIASWSWAILKDESVNFETTKLFIDYAKQMHWPYCLIDADWDRRIGEEKIKQLVAFANQQGIKLILWYNSAGDWNTTPYTPRNKFLTAQSRDAEFAKLSDWGIAGVKIDFFGGDGQSFMEYYHNILKSAANHHILVNFHGTTLPRGWQRTYPNLMTMEAIKGFEFISFGQPDADEAPSHCAMLPFTRNLFDPMDFTPMALDTIPRINRRTTPAFELALPTLFLSGIQHIAETPDGMAKMPDFVQNYLKNIPVSWEESQFVMGYPGKEVIIARKKGDTWFVTGINGENQEKTMTIDLSFIKSSGGYMITDGTEEKFTKRNVVPAKETEITFKPYGGFIMKF